MLMLTVVVVVVVVSQAAGEEERENVKGKGALPTININRFEITRLHHDPLRCVMDFRTGVDEETGGPHSVDGEGAVVEMEIKETTTTAVNMPMIRITANL